MMEYVPVPIWGYNGVASLCTTIEPDNHTSPLRTQPVGDGSLPFVAIRASNNDSGPLHARLAQLVMAKRGVRPLGKCFTEAWTDAPNLGLCCPSTISIAETIVSASFW